MARVERRWSRPHSRLATSFTSANNCRHHGCEWPLVNGWLLVEVKWASDGLLARCHQRVAGLGFARGLQVPTLPGTPYHAPFSATSAAPRTPWVRMAATSFRITRTRFSISSRPRIRNGNNTINGPGAGTDCRSRQSLRAGSQYNWYPINLYDAREGENNDTRSGTFPYNISGCNATSCTPPTPR